MKLCCWYMFTHACVKFTLQALSRFWNHKASYRAIKCGMQLSFVCMPMTCHFLTTTINYNVVSLATVGPLVDYHWIRTRSQVSTRLNWNLWAYLCESWLWVACSLLGLLLFDCVCDYVNLVSFSSVSFFFKMLYWAYYTSSRDSF